jgi:hypothetical protein
MAPPNLFVALAAALLLESSAAAVAPAASAAPNPIPQLPVGNIPLMPRMPSTYSLIDWSAKAQSFVNAALSNTSLAAGMLDVYVSAAPLSAGRTVFDTVTYVGAGPKREVFPPMHTLLTATLLGRRGLDKGCAPGVAGLDDCVASALQYTGDDGVINHYVRAAGDGPTVATLGQLWDFVYGGILVSQVASVYPDYDGGAIGAAAVESARAWSRALAALGGGPDSLPDFNITGFNFSSMTGITDPPVYRQPSSSGGFAWLMMAALEWQRYRNATAAPLPDVEEALDWSLAYFAQVAANTSDFFENLVGFGALAAARSNAERNTTYDVGSMLALAFQDGSLNQKHGYGVVVDVWGGLDVSGLVGFVSEWDPSQPYGAGGNDAYFGDGFWLAGAAAPVARYNASFARAIGVWLVNLCSASRLFYEDQLPPDHQTDAWDERNAGSVYPYEALRECDYVFERNACVGSAHPFGMGDYGCDFPSGPSQPTHCNRTANPVTNLAGYSGSSVGIAAALCVPTNTLGVMFVDLLATDFFHAPAYPTFLLYNPYDDAVSSVEVEVSGCEVVHWAGGGGGGGGGGGTCRIVDAVSGQVLATGIVPPAVVEVELAGDTAYVLVMEGEG